MLKFAARKSYCFTLIVFVLNRQETIKNNNTKQYLLFSNSGRFSWYDCKTPGNERRLSTTGTKIAACKPSEKFFRPLGSSSLQVNSPWVYKQGFPLIMTGVLKLNKNGLYVPQLLWSLSFGLFELKPWKLLMRETIPAHPLFSLKLSFILSWPL